jgi:uncharacterized membrane protein YfcA
MMTSILIGLLAGAFGGLAGLGGGVVMIPLLVRFFGFNQHQAHGTSLAALMFTGLTGAVTYSLKGNVDPMAAGVLAATAILTARFGALFAHSLPEWKLKMSFGIFVICVSILLLLKPFYIPSTHAVQGWVWVAILLVSGMAAGFIAGLMGVGGGAIMTPAMVLVLGFSQYLAQGSSLLAMVPAAAVGGYTHWRLGNVVKEVLPGLIVGIIVGTFAGGSVAQWLSEATLRLIFAAVLIWLGLRDIRKSMQLREKFLAVI